ncbi:MAG: uroporphyrinogen decarboxylase family protein [Phycisphaerae bacterium]
MIANEEKDRVWKAYRDRKGVPNRDMSRLGSPPVRVPISLAVNPRVVVLDPKWNPRGITFEEYFHNASATVEVQLAFMRYQREYLNQYCDAPTGRASEWTFYVDKQNVYDAAYFGCPVVFRDGQVSDATPILDGPNKEKVFSLDLDHPLDNPFIRKCLDLCEALKKAVAKLPADGIAYKVAPVLCNFDGTLTVSACLRGTEIFSDLYEDPDYVKRLFAFIHRGAEIRNRALAKLAGQKAFDGNVGGLADDSIQLISTATYREHVMPFHRDWLSKWSVAGPHGMHLCGDATRHFRTLRDELNVYSFDTGFPVDHGRLRRELGPDVEILGGPEVSILLNGTPQQVYERTKGILLSGIKEGGRFILKEANNLPPCCPEANLAAFYKAGLEFGGYNDNNKQG